MTDRMNTRPQRAWNSADPNNRHARAQRVFATQYSTTVGPDGREHWLWTGRLNHWGEPVFGADGQHAYICAYYLTSKLVVMGGYTRSCPFALCVRPACWRAPGARPPAAPKETAAAAPSGAARPRRYRLEEQSACAKGHPFPEWLRRKATAAGAVRHYCAKCQYEAKRRSRTNRGGQ